MKPLNHMERAVLYLHAVDGETTKQIALRQGVDIRQVNRTLKNCRTKLGAGTNSQLALRAHHTGQLTDADRTYPRAFSAAQAEEQKIRTERNKMKRKFARRGLLYNQAADADPD